MQLIKVFSQLSKKDTAIAGGKGASLGEMIQTGIPVPTGFVLLSHAFERFLEETDLVQEIDSILHTVKHQEIHTVENASEQIQALILQVEMPKDIAREIEQHFKKLGSTHVAVRSSATAEDSASAAWAGQLDSFLNTTDQNLLKNVQKCWASLFTPRAIFYRFEKDLHKQKISVAVVVQKMVESEVSGIAFSVHPVSEDRNQIIIEAAFGLGEAIVSGQITPDSYVVEKEPRRIVDKNVVAQERFLVRASSGMGNEWQKLSQEQGKRQVLTDAHILELSELILKIENHYGFPCDIEFAYEKGKFYIVQSRPITTLIATESYHEGESISRPDPLDYVRMFAGNTAFVYLLSDVFLGHYNTLGVLSVQDKNTWMSFLPKVSQEKTLTEGNILYTTRHLYEKYRNEFRTYIIESSKRFNAILNKNLISAEDIEEALTLASKHFSYYSKTEFFYTDLVDQEKMIPTVREFETLKLNGRTHLNKIIFEQQGYLRSIVKKLSTQVHVPESNLFNYSIAEFVALIKTGKEVKEEVIKDRKIFFASQDLTLWGKEAWVIVDTFLSSYKGLSSVIHGTVAYKGKVRAKAYVIPADFTNFDKMSHMVEEMKEGEILVAETTAPEIIQACKKASAIITNQGGILSHAAIVSRELKIPCIIGTDKDVTLNIKTGDVVEVDADNGVVRVLRQ